MDVGGLGVLRFYGMWKGENRAVPPNPRSLEVVGTSLLACSFPYQKLPQVLVNSPSKFLNHLEAFR